MDAENLRKKATMKIPAGDPICDVFRFSVFCVPTCVVSMSMAEHSFSPAPKTQQAQLFLLATAYMLIMHSSTLLVGILLACLGGGETLALSLESSTSRRALLRQACTASAAAAVFLPVTAANAADCFADCFKNCKLIAPKDVDYCRNNCLDYCEQPDRNDGLSGSVSASGGEVGILGGTFGQGTVPKGEDKPPSISLPGLDFSSGAGKKLIGY